jgi:hypothetical protein
MNRLSEKARVISTGVVVLLQLTNVAGIRTDERTKSSHMDANVTLPLLYYASNAVLKTAQLTSGNEAQSSRTEYDSDNTQIVGRHS